MSRHLLERDRELAPALTRAHHPQHDPRHDAAPRAEGLRETLSLVQPGAGVAERLAQGPAGQRLARRHRALERDACRDECRNALEHDGEVAQARGPATLPVLSGRNREREQTTIGDHDTGLPRRTGVDHAVHDGAVRPGRAVTERGHRCALSHDVMSASSFVPPGCPSRP